MGSGAPAEARTTFEPTRETRRDPPRGERAREEPHMAGSKRPSFLKRQKEQARLARATEKREARRARKHAKANGLDQPDAGDNDLELEPMIEGDEPPTEAEET